MTCLVMSIISAQQSLGQKTLHSNEIECKDMTDVWMPCEITIETIGKAWWLNFSDQKFSFQHDGSGEVSMKGSKEQNWKKVQARWVSNKTLCWDQVCARGEIPLD